MDMNEKIAEARGAGHGISPYLESILLSLDERIKVLEPVKPEPKPEPNPLDGTRLDH